MTDPVTTHLTLYQGATFTHTFTHRVNGTAVNLTGYSCRLQARTRIRGYVGSAAFTLTETGGLTLGGAAGTIVATLTPAVTAILTPGLYRYDVRLESGAGVVTRAFEGRITVAPAITSED
jgi:hypothetical protein